MIIRPQPIMIAQNNRKIKSYKYKLMIMKRQIYTKITHKGKAKLNQKSRFNTQFNTRAFNL